MDQTALFRTEVLNYKRKSGISIETNDIIRPKYVINETLQEAYDIFKSEVRLQQYIKTFSETWKIIKSGDDENSEVMFQEFEQEVSLLLKRINESINKLNTSDAHIPEDMLNELVLSLKEEHTETKRLLLKVTSSHSSFLRSLTIIKPSSSSNTNIEVKRSNQGLADIKRDKLLNSIPEEEKEKLLSESVQIENSLQKELHAVKQVERNAREVSELVSTFNTHVVQQHDMIENVHNNTEEAKRHVDEGYSTLLEAEKNSKGSTVKLACLILILAFVLLILNWLKN